jgi:uncharacterized protein (TIGR03067 family)
MSVRTDRSRFRTITLSLVEDLLFAGNQPASVRRHRRALWILDPTRKPRTIDMMLEVKGQTVTVRGVYEFDGETLKICISEPDEEPERPAAIDDAKGSLRILKREE